MVALQFLDAVVVRLFERRRGIQSIPIEQEADEGEQVHRTPVHLLITDVDQVLAPDSRALR